jgi:phosphatidylglycerophosphatase A
MIRNINFLFVTFFGIGTIRYAPGSISSLITTAFLFSSFHILNLSSNTILTALLVIFFFSFYAIENYIKDESDKDPKEIVIDEVIGQSIPIYLYEMAHGSAKEAQESVLFYIYIFILFRFFDIKKPFPVSYFDKNFKNSFGVIMDDVVAGFYVVLTLIVFMIIKSKLII